MIRGMVIAALVLSALPAVPARASFYSAKDLLRICTVEKDSRDYVEKAYECAAYVSGAVDAYNNVRANRKLKRCLPADVTIGALVRVTVAYLRDRDPGDDASAASSVYAATRKAWPCPKR